MDDIRPSRYFPTRLCASSIQLYIVEFQKAQKRSSCKKMYELIKNNIKCDVLELNHRLLSPSIVHVHGFSCVHRTLRMLQMLIGIIFENLIDNMIKKTIRQETTCLLMRIKKYLDRTTNTRMCFPLPGRGDKSPSGHPMSFQHHGTVSHHALNKRIQLTASESQYSYWNCKSKKSLACHVTNKR
jgi:hypothetical protein